MDHFSGLVENAIDGCSAEITGDGSKFDARVISDSFSGVSTVNRHKIVYAILEDHIKSGAIHALTIRAYTSAEWSAKNEQ